MAVENQKNKELKWDAPSLTPSAKVSAYFNDF